VLLLLLISPRLRELCVCGGGGIIGAGNTPAFTPEDEKKYRGLLTLLRSSDIEKQVTALETLHQMSRQRTAPPSGLGGWLFFATSRLSRPEEGPLAVVGVGVVVGKEEEEHPLVRVRAAC
jgi:hypothetical protein